jgi:peptide deformylase
MTLEIVKYGNPVLRQKGARIASITPEIQQLVKDMFETMYAAAGVGLAAQQVGRALQLTVVDIRGVKDRPSTMEIDGKAVDPKEQMPLVLINPEIKPFGDPATGPEGCLSFPEIYSDISRPESVHVLATGLDGKRVEFRAGGLLSRAVQHEFDHLNGILFIDRMTSDAKAEIKPELDALQSATKAALKK